MSKQIAYLIFLLRKIAAAKLVGLAATIAPVEDKDKYYSAILQALSKDGDAEMAINPMYYPQRFWGICVELDLDPRKVLEEDNPIVASIIREFVNGGLDEVEVMRSLRNISIVNGGAWSV